MVSCRFRRWSLVGILLVAALRQEAVAEKPNFVFIFSDDQSFETIAAWGNSQIQTPHLDRLARRGMSFTRAYNMGSWSGAVCVASRSMLNTGRFLWHAHALQNDLEAERAAGRFWSEYLRSAGYRTYMSGKWHVRCSTAAAFDVVRHERPGMPNQTPEGYHRPPEGRPDPWSPSDPRFEGFWKGGRHWSEVLADDALIFLQEAGQRDEPFFMYLAFNAAHDPRQSPQSFVDRYPRKSMQVPANFLPEYPFKDQIGCGPDLRDESLAPFPRTERSVQVHRQEYYALITHMDEQIGRILQGIELSGKASNTFIVFTSDHGLAIGHHGLFGKQNMYEHSVRVPFIIVGPDVPAGQRSAEPIYLQDVMPTTLELAGIPKPDHVEFHSLMPLIRGDQPSAYDSIYGAYLELQRMVTKGDFKLIVYPQAQRVRLYNLAQDPDEQVDLAMDVQYRPVIRQLAIRLLQLQHETGDTLNLQATLAEWL